MNNKHLLRKKSDLEHLPLFSISLHVHLCLLIEFQTPYFHSFHLERPMNVLHILKVSFVYQRNKCDITAVVKEYVSKQMPSSNWCLLTLQSLQPFFFLIETSFLSPVISLC